MESGKSKIPFESEEITNVAPPSKKIMYSRYLITLNSNQRGDSPLESQCLASDLKQALIKTFKKRGDEVYKFLLPGHSYTSQYIKSVKLTYVAEVGKEQERVHLHAILEIQHYTILQINIDKAREVLREYLTDECVKEGFYFRVKWVPASQPLENYLRKDPLGSLQDLIRALPKV